jgi:hypothetical protein
VGMQISRKVDADRPEQMCETNLTCAYPLLRYNTNVKTITGCDTPGDVLKLNYWSLSHCVLEDCLGVRGWLVGGSEECYASNAQSVSLRVRVVSSVSFKHWCNSIE